jgi:DNA-binding SARP family transcriptional activator/tetratricopeptide (TPR) repeat protein
MERAPCDGFDLRVLGPADLRDPCGAELGAVLAQPKRLALLCYLALATHRGFHRRDALVALLWPESSTARARHALSQSLHFLRHYLGHDAVVSRGDEVGLDASRVHCDVIRFEEHLRAGRLEAALALYRGDLLDAFHVPEAPGFERWLEGEQPRLRSRAVEAALRLSEQAGQEGDGERAVRWAEWAVERVPEDEAAARQVSLALDAAGDRAAAIQALHRCIQWLHRELEAEPAPETAALLRSLRSGIASATRPAAPPARRAPRPAQHPLPPAPVPPPAQHAPSPAPLPPPVAISAVDTPGESTREPPPPARSRPWSMGMAGVVGSLALLVGAPFTYLWISPPPRWAGWRPPTAEERTVAILPFRLNGGDGSTFLVGAVTELLAADLAGTGDVRVSDPRATAEWAAAVSHREPPRLVQEAARFGAGSCVTGSITRTGDDLRLNATWHGRQGRVIAAAAAEGAATELFGLVDRVAAELLAGLESEATGQLTRSAARTTASLTALKAFMEGERQLRGGRYGDAATSFLRATAGDPGFGLAHYRLSIAAEHLGDAPLALSAAEDAAANTAGLSDTDRALMDALVSARRGLPDQAEFVYRQILVREPANVEAWTQLGEVQFHYGPLQGRPVGASLRAWQNVLQLDPNNISARYHLARIQALRGDWRGVAGHAARSATLSPGHERVASLRALQPMGSGAAAVAQAARRLATLDDAALYMAVFDAITFGGDPAAARHLARLLTAPERPPDMRAWGHLWLAHLELAGGRWRAAQAELRRLEPLDPLAAAEYGALLALHPLLELPPPELQLHRRRLQDARLARTPTTSEDFPSAIHHALRPHLHVYLDALLEARAGNPARLDDAATALEATIEPGSAAAYLPLSLRAHLACATGDPRQALSLLEAARTGQWYEIGRWSGFLGQGPERWLSAEAHARLGRHRQALHWYEAVPQTSPLDAVYLAPAVLRRARLHARLDEPAEAARLRQRLQVLWRDADPELRRKLPELR